MISNEDAEYLLNLPKFIFSKGKKVESKTITQPALWNHRIKLLGEDQQDSFEFMWQIWQSPKRVLKMCLHYQDAQSDLGLLRVDFNAGHNNPHTITEPLPKKFRPYVGKHFSSYEHHVHYHVEGYSCLAWALPISEDVFPHNDITNNNIIDIIEAFGNTINLQTKLVINRRLL